MAQRRAKVFWNSRAIQNPNSTISRMLGLQHQSGPNCSKLVILARDLTINDHQLDTVGKLQRLRVGRSGSNADWHFSPGLDSRHMTEAHGKGTWQRHMTETHGLDRRAPAHPQSIGQSAGIPPKMMAGPHCTPATIPRNHKVGFS